MVTMDEYPISCGLCPHYDRDGRRCDLKDNPIDDPDTVPDWCDLGYMTISVLEPGYNYDY